MPYAPNMPNRESQTAGRAPASGFRGREDPVNRARSEVWLACVRALRRTPETYAAMGRFFLGDVADAERVFAKLSEEASDPGGKRASLGGKSLVDHVAGQPGYGYTKDVYTSPVWSLLGPKELSIDELDGLLDELVGQLIRNTRRAIPGLSGLEFIRFASGARLPMSRGDFRRLARRLAKSPSINAMALLCLLYGRSLRNDAADETRLLHGAVLQATRSFCDRSRFPARTAALFVFLVRRRVLGGRRTLDHGFAVLHYAEDLLGEWDVLVETAAERAWLEHEVWRFACALENTWPAQVFGACDDAISAMPAACERRYVEELRGTAVARRVSRRFEAAAYG